MADEITASMVISFSKSSSSVTGNESVQVDVSGTKYVRRNISVATTDTTLDLGAVTTPGWILLKNTDSTNYVTFGADGSSYAIKLKAGESGLFRWNGAAVHGKANTAACIVDYLLIDD